MKTCEHVWKPVGVTAFWCENCGRLKDGTGVELPPAVVQQFNGLTLSHGGFTAAKLKWTDGSFIVSGSNTININASSGFAISTSGMFLDYMAGGGARYVYVDNSGTLIAGASYP